MTFTLLPAVDVRDGKAVRLVQGRSGTETGYGDPLDAALAWQDDGAEWIHLVDLDAAFGTGDNRARLADIVGELDVKVELSGGIRDDASLAAALATGCARVNLGTAAIEQPGVVRQGDRASYGDRVAVGPGRARRRRRRLPARGARAGPRTAATCGPCWTGWSGTAAPATWSPTSTKDGTLTGPEPRAAARRVRAREGAGRGVRVACRASRTCAALAGLADVGVEGAIVGKALYTGAFTLPEALAAVSRALIARHTVPSRPRKQLAGADHGACRRCRTSS